MRELQNRRQAKGQQQRQAHAQTKQHRPDGGCRQGGFNQPGQQQHKTVMHDKTHHYTERACSQTSHYKFKGIGQRNRALGLAEHAQHGAVVKMFGGKTTRHDGHCNRAEQRRQQGNEVQEFFSAVQRLPHFGAAGLERLQPHAPDAGLGGRFFDLVTGPLHVVADGLVVASHGKPVAGAAGRLDQPGGLDVAVVNHHARRKINKTRAPVGLLHDHASQLEAGITHQHGLAELEPERVKQTGVRPGGARRRNLAGGLRCAFSSFECAGDLHVAAQRITFRNGFEGDQLARAAVGVKRPSHGRKADRRDALEAKRLGLFNKGQWRLAITAHHGIATEQLASITLKPALEAIGKKTNGGQGRDRQRHGNYEQPQFASAKVSKQGTPTQL